MIRPCQEQWREDAHELLQVQCVDADHATPVWSEIMGGYNIPDTVVRDW